MKNVFGFITAMPTTKLMNQIATGIWLSLIAGLGIISQSWKLAINLAILGGFFAAGSVAFHFLRSKNLWIKRTAKVGVLLYLGTFVFYGLMFAEQMYYTNSKTYPVWLTSGVFNAEQSNFKTLSALRDNECKDYGYLSITQKSGSLYYARCGQYWYNSKTFVFENDPTQDAK